METPLEYLLRRGVVAINIGVDDFAASLQSQDVSVLHVDWSPPAGGDQEIMDILDKLL